jgi:hypothetical protein
VIAGIAASEKIWSALGGKGTIYGGWIKMGKLWLRKKCVRCDGEIYFLPQWKAVPDYCVACQLLNVNNLRGLLENFLESEGRLRLRRLSLDERVAYDSRETLRLKVKETVGTNGGQQQIAQVCANDKELKRLIFRLSRERRISENYRPRSERPLPKRVGAIVQGGSPGLGKRS